MLVNPYGDMPPWGGGRDPKTLERGGYDSTTSRSSRARGEAA